MCSREEASSSAKAVYSRLLSCTGPADSGAEAVPRSQAHPACRGCSSCCSSAAQGEIKHSCRRSVWVASSLGGQHRLEKQICGLEKQKALKLDELRGKAERSHPAPGTCPKSQHQPQAGALCVGVASGGEQLLLPPQDRSRLSMGSSCPWKGAIEPHLLLQFPLQLHCLAEVGLQLN